LAGSGLEALERARKGAVIREHGAHPSREGEVGRRQIAPQFLPAAF
jgi:hypothetical protein